MKIKHKLVISLVFGLVGLMVAIQFQSNREPTERDTRDLWEIRSQLQDEQKQQQQLYQQIREAETTIEQYQAKSESEKVQTLKESLEVLKEEAGFTEITKAGLIIDITPVFLENESLQTYPELSPELLNRLINELNAYGATDIAVANERIVHITPIRSVNGETYVNNHPLPSVPIQVKVLADNPERLIDYMEVSQSKEDFSIENLQLDIHYEEEITLAKYEDPIVINSLQVTDSEEAGEQ
ncbi:DUF881 domain-containing protein [Sediminibacillus albus]|uniref:Uncharacterized conserved protein YlxW, UPF0749 family n=1 Tax=Sediminibacillus albus TaxID=407036 RepID=A0A1G8W982_9BACI|nr:DUF881 domain-containing protein [Sediminibacillus albus]SDJ74110.1 Uncharacterized conserved protein YlxW, UPF0749 family [Sediminibacillus albus]